MTPKQADPLTAFVRNAILSRHCLIFSSAFSIFIGVTDPGGLLGGLSVAQRCLVNLAHLAIFLGYSYWILPHAMNWALKRGWPAALLQVLIYLPLSAILAFEVAALTHWPPTPTAVIWSFAVMIPVVAIACIVGLLYFQSFVLPATGLQISTAQLWSFTAPSNPQSSLQMMLDQAVRGRVLRVESEKQYVQVVTEAGQQMIRLPLTRAVELLPPNDGIRIHRSHWVAYDQIEALSYENGNPRVHLHDGRILPASRDKISEIRAGLNTQG